MLGLRTAGKALLNFDEGYARRANRDLQGLGEPAQSLGGTSVRDMLNMDMGLKSDANLAEKAAVGGLLVGGSMSNVGYRYGLPAAGLTLAGKALYDLTQSYQTNGTLEP